MKLIQPVASFLFSPKKIQIDTDLDKNQWYLKIRQFKHDVSFLSILFLSLGIVDHVECIIQRVDFGIEFFDDLLSFEFECRSYQAVFN